MLARGRELGCTEAWLGAEPTDVAARHLYAGAGGAAETFILYSFPLTADTPLAADTNRHATP